MTDELRLRVISSIDQVPAAQWDACANPIAEVQCETPLDGLEALRQKPEAIPYNPFISHDFLYACEASGSAVARTGWQAQHLIAEGPNDTVVGAVPKTTLSGTISKYL